MIEIEVLSLAEISLVVKVIAAMCMLQFIKYLYEFGNWVWDTIAEIRNKFKHRKVLKRHEPEDEDIGRTE